MRLYLYSILFFSTSTFAQEKELPVQKITFEEKVINVIRADKKSPTTETTLNTKSIETNYAGQEMPAIIAKTPSITWYSDNGGFSGYSYIRLRGIDQTRINFTLNGVPLNDPEDQVIYFSNFPDFLNSVQSIQIQRGVGTSTYGAASFGGSVNMDSPSLQEPTYVQLSSSYGSYNTYRLSPELNTGLIQNKWSFYGRYSAQGSDGFREHSNSKGDSFFLSGGYFSDHGVLKLTAFTGHARSQLSYLAVPESTLRTNYRNNPLTEDEKDDFQQSVAMLQYTLPVNDHLFFTSTAYYNYAQGNYDVLFAPDLNNFELESHFYGGMSSIEYKNRGFKAISGMHVSDYVRYHSSFIQPFEATELYKNAGHKNEFSTFVKLSQQIGKIGLFGDLQFRTARFSYEQDDSSNLAFDSIRWNFINPKGGITYSPTSQNIIYASMGKTSREPTRNDMFAGFDNIDASNYAQIGDFSKVKPESVIDYELGTKFIHDHFDIDLNVYDMEFTNEIAAIGQLSYIGLPLRKNVESSYRRGIELFADVRPINRLRFLTEANVSRNRIKTYTADFSAKTYTDVEPLLTPTIQVFQAVEYKLTNWLEANLNGTYIGKSFLDNTDNENFMVPSSLIFNSTLNFTFSQGTRIKLLVNNIGNTKYYTSGYVQSNESYYFPMATRNYFVSFEQRFQ